MLSPPAQLYPRSFYSEDPLDVAAALLGAVLVHDHPQRARVAGRIVETEAYRGEEDLACHASAGRTKRTDVMYGPPGFAYVYLIYGMYNMFNVVTWPEGKPSAVLVRGVEPIQGLEGTSNGPGKLTRAMDIDLSLNREDLCGSRLFILQGEPVTDGDVERTKRIGISYAGEWTERLWRFSVRGNPYVSKAPRTQPGDS